MLVKILSIFLLFFFTTCIALNFSKFTDDTLTEEYGEVIYCSALFRHGDRTANNPYPTDPYQLDFWKEGKAQLTKTGKLRAYELGQWFRKRYSSLVENKPYRYDFLLVNSSDIDRTLMSAELFLAGFYPPSKEEMWDPFGHLQWQPISVHTTSKHEDNVMMQQFCDMYELEVDILNNSPEFEILFKENKETFDYVGKHSGIVFSQDNIYNAFSNLWDIYDDLFVEDSNNLTLPSWTKSVYPQPLKTVAELFFSLVAYDEEQQRLRAGPMLKHMIQDMLKKQEYAESWNRMFHLYSGHDVTVGAFLSTLGVFNGIAPPYTSLVMLELRKKINQYYVTLLYHNSSESPTYLLELPKCKNPCTLNDFIRATKSVIPDDWNYECHVSFTSKLFYSILSLSTILHIVLFGVLIGILAFIGYHVTKRRRQYDNIKDNNDDNSDQ